MNIVSQMIAAKRQEFEGKLQEAATNPLNSTFQQKILGIHNANTEATSSSSTTDEAATLTNVDDENMNMILNQAKQLQSNVDISNTISTQVNQLEDNAEISGTISNPVQQPQATQSESKFINEQSSNNGGDTWNIMERYNISAIKASNDTKYTDIISEMSEKYGIPIALIKKVIETESNFQNNASSPAGAQGLMQLMPATAKSLGVTDSFDPRQNIEAGVKYLSQKLDVYDGDLVLALAAYNAGSGNVQKYNGVPPFTETVNYIKKITGIDVSSF